MCSILGRVCMANGARDGEFGSSRRGTPVLGKLQPEPRVLGDSELNSNRVSPTDRTSVAGASAVVAGRPRLPAPERAGAERSDVVREAQPGSALACSSVEWRVGRGRRSGRGVLPTGRCSLRPEPGSAGGGATARPAGSRRGGLVVAHQRWPRRDPLAAGVAGKPVRSGFGAAIDAGQPGWYDVGGPGDRAQPNGGAIRRGGRRTAERGCPAAHRGLGVAVAGRRPGGRPAARACRAAAWGAGRPGVGSSYRTAPQHGCRRCVERVGCR